MESIELQALWTQARQHHHAGRLNEAEAIYRRMLVYEPNSPEIHNNLGIALHDQGAANEAVSHYQKALALRPDSVDTRINLSAALRDLGRLEEGIDACRQAVQLRPDSPEAFHALGVVLMDAQRMEPAIAAFRASIGLRPDHAETHAVLGHALLLNGELEAGWPEFEWRHRTAERMARNPGLPYPAWTGDDPAGRRILIHCEGGLGDTLQFIRYAPLLAGRGARVIVRCQHELGRLLEGQCGIGQFFTTRDPLPEADAYCFIQSLPALFHTTMVSVPAQVPYVWPSTKLIDAWRERVIAGNHVLKVGLNWAGNPHPPRNRRRTIPVTALAPLVAIPRVQFFGLQTGDAAREQVGPGLKLIDLAGHLTDMADTAVAIANLDLVITCDTSVAHLAGAMGKPVWVALPYGPDWRWLLNRKDSPWYPGMRLFRQPRPGDWEEPIGKIVLELKSGGYRPQ